MKILCNFSSLYAILNVQAQTSRVLRKGEIVMGNVTILQPKNCKFEDIKHDIKQTAEQIIDIATYPNGFVLTMEQTAEGVNVSSNKPLIKIDDSTYQIPE